MGKQSTEDGGEEDHGRPLWTPSRDVGELATWMESREVWKSLMAARLPSTKTFKMVGIVLCLLFIALSILFYVAPFYECPNCHYFTCIPFMPTLCENMKVEVKKTVVIM